MQRDAIMMEDESCCKKFTYKLRENLPIVVVSLVLLLIVLCVSAGLYHGITLNEYSHLAIGLGIWLPSILLGMICTYVTVICVQDCKRSPVVVHYLPHESPEGASQCTQSNQSVRINLDVKQQPEIRKVTTAHVMKAIEDPCDINCENSPVYRASKMRGQRRSLSSSDLTVSYHRRPSKRNFEKPGCSSEITDDDSQCSVISNRTRQETGRPSHGRIKRSISESRTHRCRKSNSKSMSDIMNSPEIIKKGKYAASEDKRVKTDSHFCNRTVEAASRIHQSNDRTQNTTSPESNTESEYSASDEEQLDEYEFQNKTGEKSSRIKQHSAEYSSRKNRHGRKYETEFHGSHGCTEENKQFISNYQRAICNCSLNNRMASKYPFQEYEMTRFHPYKIVDYPQQNIPMLHPFSPSRADQDECSKSSREIIRDCSSEKRDQEQISNLIIPDNLLKAEDRRNYISNQKISEATGFQSAKKRKAVYQVREDLRDDGVSLPDSKKMTKKTSSRINKSCSIDRESNFYCREPPEGQ